MYGYIIPDKPDMLIKDFTYFRAFYCGLCKSIGAKCGQLARFSTNYDMTFFNVLVHDLLNKEVKINQEVCILNPVRKKSVVENDELTELVVDLNTLLIYYKIEDDYIDGNTARALALAPIIKPKAKKVIKKYPEINVILKENFARLREMEKANEKSVDKVSDPFSIIISDVAKIIVKDKFNDSIKDLCYNLGKWVYLMDALDDIEEDAKDKRYNPFLAKYDQEFTTRQEFLDKNRQDLEYTMMSVYNGIVNNYNQLDCKVAEGILSNVIYLGLKRQTDNMLKGETKCKTTRL